MENISKMKKNVTDKIKVIGDFDKYEIKSCLIKNLFRVVKNKKLYCFLRGSLGVTPHSGIDGVSSIYYRTSFFRSNPSPRNPLNLCYTLNSLIETLDSYIKPQYVEIKTKDDTETNVQIYISECINIILHSCLEFRIPRKDMKVLEEIGREAFNMTCTKLFGDGFVDRTEAIAPPPQIQMPTKDGVYTMDFSEFQKYIAYVGTSNSLNRFDYYDENDGTMGFPWDL